MKNLKAELPLIWNREKKAEEVEKVYGGTLVNLIYGTKSGQVLADNLLSHRFVSKLFGIYKNSTLSGHEIDGFIREFQIPMDEFEPGPFRSFNDFFTRHFRPKARNFVTEDHLMPAFAEGRYLAFEKITSKQTFPVKGVFLSPGALLGTEDLAQPFIGGPMLIARLCPTDYHRFHYPDEGLTREFYRVPGALHSINPLALRFRSDIFSTNERIVNVLETKNFGSLAYIEVGALCVGKIIQTCNPDRPFSRGQEKGYFSFGGSTIILMGQPGIWKPDSDLLEQTGRDRETLIKLGERVGSRI